MGKELVYHLATSSPSLEGQEWEAIFARLIGADWKPSNVGLDDIVLKDCAWGAKTVKAASPAKATKVRLISGRNAPIYSFGTTDVKKFPADELGSQVLSIYNNRVWAVRKKYKHLRTVVLMKSEDLLESAVFELETVAFDSGQYSWSWNKNGNLEGCDKRAKHCFTWQPHGAQFTIIEEVPPERLAINLKKPLPLSREHVLREIGFSEDWVQVL
ncbi:MAG: hypothetical protein ACO1QB_07925 [Verrucomicrobiales bacterium]